MTDFAPPRSAEFFGAALIADRELRDAVLGDLAEEYSHVADAQTPKAANAWYWSQLIRSAIPFSVMAVARGGWFAWTRLAVATALSLTFFVQIYARSFMWLIHYSWLSHTGPSFLAAMLISQLLGAVIAGFIAALIAGRSPLAAALSLAAIAIAFGLYLIVAATFQLGVFRHLGAIHDWYVVGTLGRALLMSVGFLIGGMIRGGALVRLRPR